MRILVTGSRGFIGQHLVRYLKEFKGSMIGINRYGGHDFSIIKLAEEHPFIEYDIDVLDTLHIKYLLTRFKPDIIFHLAGCALVKSQAWTTVNTNVMGTLNLLEHAPAGCRFVYASSATVYGNAGQTHSCDESTPPAPTSAYAASKLAGEALVEAYTAQGRVRGLSLRLVANVGRGSTHGLLHDVVAKLHSDSATLELFGDSPGSRKPFMYVDDTASAIVYLALLKWKKMEEYQVFNVSPWDSINVAAVADIAMQVTGINKPVKWLGQQSLWPGDNPLVRIDPTKLDNTSWEPTYEVSEHAVRAAVRDIMETL